MDLGKRIRSILACAAVVTPVALYRMVFLIHLAPLVVSDSVLKHLLQSMRLLLIQTIGEHDKMLIPLLGAILGKTPGAGA
jgi:hypothetical protein